MGKSIDWDKIFSIHIFVKGLVSRIYFKNHSYKSLIKDMIQLKTVGKR